MSSLVRHWSIRFFLASIFLCAVLPIVFLENSDHGHAASQIIRSADFNSNNAVSVHDLVQNTKEVLKKHHEEKFHKAPSAKSVTATATATEKKKNEIQNVTASVGSIALADLHQDTNWAERPVRRGVAGRPMEQTPAVVGAKRAHVECDVNVDSIAYWNSPTGKFDETFQSPFAYNNADADGQNQPSNEEEKYISFAADRGGWNNVRMSMEIIFVVAAATGRTLVLPPKEPLYLLHADKGSKYRGFADFFPIHTEAFRKRVKVISFEEFLRKEGGKGQELAVPEANRSKVEASASHCEHRKKSKSFCGHVIDYLSGVGYIAPVSAHGSCLVFDADVYNGKAEPTDAAAQNYIESQCGEDRERVYFNQSWQQHKLIHFHASDKAHRLLAHYYGMVHFSDPTVSHYFKRFVRDFLHYHDSIVCAAGKIVKALQVEGKQRGFVADAEGGSGYSALHVRRGDLQYKKVKIPAAEWYENTKELWKPNEILYVATDERNKTFFDDLAKHHTLRFLDDYWDFADLSELDPNYMGMIDTIVASRGRAFAGTWFSTFTGYINRMRGYHGMSMMDSWYSFLPKKEFLHSWKVGGLAFAYEWPDGWVGIDANEWPSRDKI